MASPKGIILKSIRRYADLSHRLHEIKDPFAKARAKTEVAGLEIFIGQQLDALAAGDPIPSQATAPEVRVYPSMESIHTKQHIAQREYNRSKGRRYDD